MIHPEETIQNTDSQCLPIVLELIQEIGGVAGIQPDQDFYDAGVASVQALPLLMGLEDKFEVSIPDDRFITARTPRALCDIITALKGTSS